MNGSKYFRVSITGKCNFNCPFCHREGNPNKQTDELTTNEILFACAEARKFGFEKFKLTGGEPTLHRDILEIVSSLSKIDLPDLSMITNGSTLKDIAKPLWDNGLRRINVTLNTLQQEQLQLIAKNVNIEDIVCGIEKALSVGFKDLKLNFVYSGEESDANLADVLDYAGNLGITLVLLPVISNTSHYTLNDLYIRIAEYGILEETRIEDREGIRKTLITLNNSSKVLLRQDELSQLEPFLFCKNCLSREICREGIFPLRLSCSGELIACMANSAQRLNVKQALQHADTQSFNDALLEIESWYR